MESSRSGNEAVAGAVHDHTFSNVCWGGTDTH